jgi:hypothetical protein
MGLFGCLDSDQDGWDDLTDAYPDDQRLWSDGDGDGYADQSDTERSDDCPEVFGTSYETFLGCLDGDGDGWSDSNDAYPEDAAKYEASAFASNIVLGGIGLLVLLLAGMFVVRSRRSSQIDELPMMPLMSINAPAPAIQPAGPPLPPEGLPPGWTMEQWAWYGEDYLKNR